MTIAEHDKERGTRQKIDEPDTPSSSPRRPQTLRAAPAAIAPARRFARYDGPTDADSLASPDMKPVAPTNLFDGRASPSSRTSPPGTQARHRRLEELHSKLAAAAEGGQDPDERLGWVAEMEEKEHKAKEFAAKRNAHYNMAGVLGRTWDDEDDEDDVAS